MKTRKYTIYDLRFTRRSRVSLNSEHEEQPSNGPCPKPSIFELPSRKSQIVNRKSQEAVALVITLILLSVTLVMAVAFLAVSRRGRASVTTTQDATTAKLAVDSAQAKAIGRIVSQIETTTNPYIFSLIVSTNYVNRLGFVPNSANPTNVNYDYEAASGGNGVGPISGADLLQNIANLYYNPRPPVFYSNDFRFYLDLNRNGRYDTNGVVQLMDDAGKPILTSSNTPIYNLEVGDPEWIGILAHPDQPHGPNNPFIARYCFIAVPANSADLNFNHNQALNLSETTVGEGAGNPPGVGVDGYSRNQGVGSWEINLGAFLTDLNTNRWDPFSPGPSYTYPEGPVNGTGFGASIALDDARALVAWRYDNIYPLLASAQTLFGGSVGWVGLPMASLPFNNGIDYYSLRQQSSFDTNIYDYSIVQNTTPWLGAPQTNNYFSYPSELFNVSRSDLDFVTNLYSAGTNYSTYDRYTFYRMLGQLGTDTKPASGRINLNYQNTIVNYDTNKTDSINYGSGVTNVPTSIAIVPNMETNFQSWSPRDFFTAAADRLLRTYTTEWYEAYPSNYVQTYYGITGYSYTNLNGINVTNIQYLGQTNQIPSFGITNIPVYMNGSFVYTPAVNRLLQLAANIYDASTNTSISLLDSNYPSVFRPVFYRAIERNYFLNRVFTNIYIKGFQYVQELPGNGVGSVPVPQSADPALSVAGTIFTTPVELNSLPLNPNPFFGEYSVSNVWGIPWIIGAKKGLPNFNGFELDNTFFIERELQFNRGDNISGSAHLPYTTNQMYLIGISNAFAMDDWNSYGLPYNNKLTIFAQNFVSVAVTNSDNYNNVNLFGTNVAFPSAYWPGQTYATPFGSNVTVIQNLAFPPSPTSTNGLYVYYYNPTPKTLGNPGYTFAGPCFIPASLNPSNYLDQGTPPLPQFGLMATNHLQAFILDTDSAGNTHILDYVQLGNMNSTLNINAAIADPDSGKFNGDLAGLWSTNLYGNSDTPWGVVEQYNVSSGSSFPSEDSDESTKSGQTGWTTAPIPGLGTLNSVDAQKAYFEAFFQPGNAVYDPVDHVEVTNTATSVQAPYTPMRCIIQKFVYQANDPLVHYTSADLNDFADDKSNRVNLATLPQTNTITTIGTLSDRYLPWGNYDPGYNPGGSPLPPNQLKPPNGSQLNIDQNPFNFAYKDPLVWSPDNWDFPTGKYPSAGWLGRVHRGTPWQSVYLKSTNIFSLYTSVSGGPVLPTGAYTWQIWTGNPNAEDAFDEIPAQDRLLFDLFTAAPNDDAMRGQVSVNIGADDATNMLAGLSSWSALLSGTTVFATNNTTPDFQIQFSPGYQQPAAVFGETQPPYYNLMTVQPLGDVYPSGNIANSPIWNIVQGINATRTNFVTIDGLHGTFEHVGDILATPQLSDASPYLADPGQLPDGMSDEMLEWLPQQMMGLMTVSGTPQNPPRYVIYCYGQTLKPAPNGLVSGGQYFGMCTNYQVTAESAARVVIEVQNTPTPATPNAAPHIVVEQYNGLPPE